MAKLSANNSTILCQYFDPTRRCLTAIRSDGRRLRRYPTGSWRLASQKKADISLEHWTSRVLAAYADLPAYYRGVKAIPSEKTLERWSNTGVAKTVDGQTIEPDGTAANGAPSWLLALGLI